MFLQVIFIHDIWGDKKLFFSKSPNSLTSFLNKEMNIFKIRIHTYAWFIIPSSLIKWYRTLDKIKCFIIWLIPCSLIGGNPTCSKMFTYTLPICMMWIYHLTFPYIATICFYHFCHPMNLRVFYCLAVT